MKTQKRQHGSGGGRDASWVKSGGSCRLNSSTPPLERDPWVSTQHLKSWLCHTQRRAARLAVGDSLCISAPNTLPSQPSSGRDQMCKNHRWAAFCTGQTKASRAVHRFTWENHQSLFQFGCFVHDSQSDHHLSNEGDVVQISLSSAGGY